MEKKRTTIGQPESVTHLATHATLSPDQIFAFAKQIVAFEWRGESTPKVIAALESLKSQTASLKHAEETSKQEAEVISIKAKRPRSQD